MSQSRMPLDGTIKPCRCGERRPEVPRTAGRCYECAAARAGRKRTERHHPFGRHNQTVREITVEMPANHHRALTARSARRPEVLKRPGDNPLHRIAAFIVTIGEAADALADFARREQWPEWVAKLAEIFASAAGPAADSLLILAGKLEKHIGSDWPDILGMPSWCF